ncbi:MAG: hypothetical protein KAJ64_07345 [Thermoplasmata archaeon]|nr:hypothetical protein [Thermoplasmata archaeon]
MRNPKLKNTGLIVAIIGGILTLSGLYMGGMPYYQGEISDYSIQIIIGTIMLIAGLLVWIFVFE